MMKELFEKYKKVALFYSGGKDSLACLLLLEPYWDKLIVAWVNTGAVYEEVREHMDKVRGVVPSFVELHSDVTAFQKELGKPVDVVVLRNTAGGWYFHGERHPKVCSAYDCCLVNVWTPMRAFVENYGVDCVLRGDRGAEVTARETAVKGTVFKFPIFDWTDEQVRAVLESDTHGLVQERHYLHDDSSLDCVGCLCLPGAKGHERLEYLRKYHPDIARQCDEFSKDYAKVVQNEINHLGGLQ